jgi:ABC-type glutathione transport system ATPase component
MFEAAWLDALFADEARHRSIERLRLVGMNDPDSSWLPIRMNLSGGRAQRVCFAPALVHRPKS